MNPEEASQALEDLGGGIMVPIHYGCFPLTDEDPREPPRRLYAEWVRRGWDLNHLWLLAPGHHRSLEDIMFIPTVRSEGEHGIAADKVEGGRLSEWTIGICPHLGEMVDLEATGLRSAEDGALTLDRVRCSAHGDLEECRGGLCPLRDPAFLKTYGIHGVRHEDGSIEPFRETAIPPHPRWWRDELRIERKEP
jgi:hypothetical protein